MKMQRRVALPRISGVTLRGGRGRYPFSRARFFILATFILAATPVWAQRLTLPGTGTWTDKNGTVIGSTTLIGNRIYMRDLKGEHVATIVFEKDGTRTIYDPNGKVLDQIKGR